MSLFNQNQPTLENSVMAQPSGPPPVIPLTERVMQQHQRIEHLEKEVAELREAIMQIANASKTQLGLIL